MGSDCSTGLDWCAGGHRCSRALGTHRSEPWSQPTGYGRLVATKVRHGTRDRLEVHAVIDLPPGAQHAQDLVRLLLLGLDLTVRDVLRGRLGRVRAAYQRLTGTRVR